MLKVFKLKVTEDGLGRYNAHKVYIVHVVADNSDSAICRVFTENTRCVEIVDVHPCLIVSNK